MAKDKERSINPAQAQRKLEKAKALKKSKAELQTKRNEKLAKRNPDRIQRQIDDLKALESSGDIKPREKAILADLERDLKAVNKAKEALGQPANSSNTRPPRPQNDGNPNQSSLGKRRHDGQRVPYNRDRRESSGSATDDSVRRIPWPRDTPPPVPKKFRRQPRPYQAPAQPIEAKTTYSSAPQVRDLKKEAVSRFVPNVVKRKQEAVRGKDGQLLEPEELDRLEAEGYMPRREEREQGDEGGLEANDAPKFSEYNPKNVDELRRLREEEEAFEREMAMQDGGVEPGDRDGGGDVSLAEGSRLVPSRHVEMEEVEDEDA